MRNQQAPTVRVNVFYPEIEPQCKDSAETCRIYTVPAGHPKKVRMCLTSKEQGGVLSSTGQLNVASPSECQRYQDSTRGKLLLAQPVFVIDNKERPIKRHAAELIWKSENEHSIYPEKRARSSSFTYRASHSPNHKDNRDSDRRRRSSSFTLLPTFPAMKNNIFMPSTILKVHPEGAVTELGRLHDGNVIKPATLQPPKGLPCQNGKTDGSGSASQKCQDDDKSSSLEQIRTPLNNVDKPKPALEPTCILGTKTRNQHFEKISTTKNNISDFIFGEKMNERVKSPPGSADTQTGLSLVNPSPIGKQPPLCSWAYQKHCGKNTGLIESAAAYTSKSSLKYTPDQVEIITGEESERNVLQVNCKLFTLNKDTQMWIERGRGYLRLNDTARNDSGMFKSRIVMRNHGNLKLILNSKIWDQMKLEKVSRKNLLITATDLGDQSVKVFLIQASVKDAGRLFAAIHHRLVSLRCCKNQEQETTTHTETERDPNLLSCDSEDEDESTLHNKSSDHAQRIRRRPVLHS